MAYVTLDPRDDLPALALRYETCGDRVSAPVLILVHELGGNLESFRAFGSLLAAQYRVIAFDQRSVGLSEKVSVPFTLVDLARDIARLVDALAIRGPFHMMGLAMGAVVAAHFAARHAEELDSLVLCDGTPEINQAAGDYLRSRAAGVRRDGIRSIADQNFKTSFRGLAEPMKNPAWAAYHSQFLSTSAETYAMHCEALAGMNLQASDFAKIACPTLCLTGAHDSVWPPAVGAALASRLPNATFEVVDNASHFPPIQATEYVAARMVRFLGGA
jgi:3-oxoadipate enol-lactonase